MMLITPFPAGKFGVAPILDPLHLAVPPFAPFPPAVMPSKLKALLAVFLLLCASVPAAQEEGMVFAIWDSSGAVVHKAFKDRTHGQTAASPYDEVVPVREIPQVLFAPPPKYPKRLADLGMKGWVRLKFTINEQGEVQEPEVIDMHPRKYFARAALQTIRRYRFAAPMLDGTPTPLPDVTVRMTFDPDG